MKFTKILLSIFINLLLLLFTSAFGAQTEDGLVLHPVAPTIPEVSHGESVTAWNGLSKTGHTLSAVDEGPVYMANALNGYLC